MSMQNVMDMNEIEKEIEQFLKEHVQVTNENAKEVIDFLMQYESEWSKLSEVNYMYIIQWLGAAYCYMDGLDRGIDFMEKQIENFRSIHPKQHAVVSHLYHDLGLLFADKHNREGALEAFKMWIYHLQKINQNYGELELYSFRVCSKYALKDLRYNTMTVSNPATFNDPLDCLVLHWYNNTMKNTNGKRGKYVYGLIKDAYSFTKIRCFVRNTQLTDDEKLSPVSKVEKQYNPLMWAHYADGHTGFCVKYNLPTSWTSDMDNTDLGKQTVSLWGEVCYVGNVNINYGCGIEGSFFTKSDVWNYEKEFRLLHYDPTWKGDYKPIKLPPSCVKEVYFGLKCSEENKQAIRKALAGQQVKFFQIETQPHDFYKLTSKPALEPTRKRCLSRFLSLFKKISLSLLKM